MKRSQTLPWISNDVRKLMRARNKADDWMKYQRLRNQVVWELKKAKLQTVL